MPIYNGADYMRTALDSILSQTFTDRKNTWVWQDRGNRRQLFVNTFRSTEALQSVLMSSGLVSAFDKAVLVPDLLAFQVSSRVRGKIHQYRRNLRIGYGRGQQLDPASVEQEIKRLIELDT